MKKFLFVIICNCLLVFYSISQPNNTIILSIDSVNIKGFKAGDDVIVPVHLDNSSGGLISVLQLYINYDHEILTWKGNKESPLNGVQKFNKIVPYIATNWVFNSNDNQFVAFWNNSDLKAVNFKGSVILFEVIFTYNDTLAKGNESVLNWGDTFEDNNGMLVKGKTQIYDEKGQKYKLTLNNGEVKN